MEVNPLGLAAGEEGHLLQKELSEGSQGLLNMGKGEVNHLLRNLLFFYRSEEQGVYNEIQLLMDIKREFSSLFLHSLAV